MFNFEINTDSYLYYKLQTYGINEENSLISVFLLIY